MGKRMDHITTDLQSFIEKQKLFFVGTALAEGRVNVSPKGLDTLRVLGPNRVVWINLTGSGNETAAHVAHQPRMTLMFCAFEGNPLILRLYGTAKAHHENDPEFETLAALFPETPGNRQLVDLEVDLVQTSCGFGVPLMDFVGERTILPDWAQKKGRDGLRDYWSEKNATSLDGQPTHFAQND